MHINGCSELNPHVLLPELLATYNHCHQDECSSVPKTIRLWRLWGGERPVIRMIASWVVVKKIQFTWEASH